MNRACISFLFVILSFVQTLLGSHDGDHFSEVIPQVSSPTIVGGVVDVLSGHFILPDTQMTIAGPVPYQYGWSHTQSLSAVKGAYANGFDSSSISFMCHKWDGPITSDWTIKLGQNTILFNGKHRHSSLKPSDHSLSTWCNVYSGELSARNNPYNYVLITDQYRDPVKKLQVCCPDGTRKIFRRQPGNVDPYPVIEKEMLPSGHDIHYCYPEGQSFPNRIYASNREGTTKFWDLDINLSTYKNTTQTVSDNRGNWIRYHTKKGSCAFLNMTLLEKIECCDRPPILFGGYQCAYGKNGLVVTDTRIRKVRRPDDRELTIEYHKEKVSAIRQTLKKGYSPVIYRFEYNDKEDNWFWNKPTKGNTDVFDGNGYKSIYRYTIKGDHHPFSVKGYRPYRFQSIEQLDHGQKHVKITYYFWGDDKTADKGRLKYKAEIGQTNSIIEGYTYDPAGNLISHSLYGNLTEANACQLYLLSSNKLNAPRKTNDNEWRSRLKHLDCYKRHFTYFSNKFHNLKSVRDDFGSHVKYEYVPDSNIIKSKTVMDGDREAIVYTYGYNLDKVLIREEVATPIYRILKDIQPRDGPDEQGFGLPERITEYAVSDSGSKILLKETRFAYGAGDKITREEVYGSDGEFCYAKEFFYDDKRRLIAEVDPMGQTTRYEYDNNFNKISEEVIESGLKTFYEYDLGNRLITKRLVADTGESIDIAFEYDVMNNLTKVSHPIEGVTQYAYDCQGNMVKQTSEPLIMPDGSQKKQVFTCAYDGIGTTRCTRDPNKAKTTIQRTSTGLPLVTTYPDNTKEICTYLENGKLLRKQVEGGVTESFAYDTLGHLTTRETVDPQAGISFVEQWEYEGDKLVKNIDRNGNVIRFSYDPAGRLTEETAEGPTCKKRVTYGYDTLGRRTSTTRWLNDHEYICEEKQIDFVGRTILNRQFNETGLTLSLEEYTYDCLGRVTAKIRHIDDEQRSIEFWDYNPFGHVIAYTDPMGQQTTTDYDYYAFDDLGRRGILKTSCDPLGKVTKTLIDAKERVLESHEFDPSGNLISHSTHFYDHAGNAIFEQHEVFDEGGKLRDYAVSRDYDSMNRLLCECEQPGSKDEKKTSYEYDQYGRLAKITQPNGTTLSLVSTKDQLVKKRQSSDGTIDEEWVYDHDLKPVKVKSHGFDTTRKYDSFGRMVHEKLANGLEIAYKYDALDRLQKIIYPNADGSADYAWENGRFSHVQRILGNGTAAYRYSQADHNYLGRAREVVFPGKSNRVECAFDLKGRPKSLVSRHFSQTDIAYNEVGSLVSFTQNDAFGNHEYAFTYDPWYHLASESGRCERSYLYDSLGNRTAKNQSDYTINALNQIASSGEAVYKYDPNGCLVSRAGSTRHDRFTYDALNRLTSIKSGTEKYFFYDPFNRRIAESQEPIDDPGEGDSRYLFHDGNEIALYDIEDKPKYLRLLLPGGSEIGATVAVEICGTPYAPISSIHGHISALVTLQGDLAGAWHYTAFGEETSLAGSLFCPWRSWSKTSEDLSGFVCFGRRYYDPSLGRWITPDPEGFIDGPNLYAYVQNRPLTYFDHYGLYTYQQAPDSTIMRSRADWQSSNEYKTGMGWDEYYWKYAYQNRYVNLKYGEPRIISLREGLSMIKDRIDPEYKMQENANKIIVHKNGIWTRPDDAMYQLYELCRYGNCNGYLIYNPDHDRKLPECMALKRGHNTQLTGMIHSFYDQLVEKNPDIHILASYHSEGGLFERNASEHLSPEVKRHIYFFGVAPANIVPNDGCLGCYNVRSSWDIVPHFNRKQWILHPEICQTIDHPFYNPNPFDAHSFDNKIYDEIKIETVNDFLNK